ncbi:RNA polymerase sigma factor [Levilactobacillus fujinensis]|uniref:RNA polymerase sigma factor n=1 Tax=Levilactobacillus fujinensis TaxID=2486024 RepID=A0ABW1TKE7_9LACO|nr:RNA polymerase sigma factor [Levilactobacillus fujinensis]
MRLQRYEKLMAQMAVELQRYLVSRGASHDVAEDIVQDVFVKLLEMELVLPPDKLRPYMYRVAWSTYLDYYRRTQRYQGLVKKYLGPALEIATQPADYDVGQAMSQLSHKEQHLLLLRYEQNLSITRVAEQLKIRPAAVKMRLHRVHKKLEKIMMRSEQG